MICCNLGNVSASYLSKCILNTAGVRTYCTVRVKTFKECDIDTLLSHARNC